MMAYKFHFLLTFILSMCTLENDSIVPNTCSSLGSNAPTRPDDCTVFILTSPAMCCFLNLTLSQKWGTACLNVAANDKSNITAVLNEVSSGGNGKGSIKCSGGYLSVSIKLLILLLGLAI